MAAEETELIDGLIRLHEDDRIRWYRREGGVIVGYVPDGARGSTIEVAFLHPELHAVGRVALRVGYEPVAGPDDPRVNRLFLLALGRVLDAESREAEQQARAKRQARDAHLTRNLEAVLGRLAADDA